jgi:ubiquinone/menaquinone biosynthesis C-methylase UbiE
MHSIGADTRFWDRASRKYAAAPIQDMAGYERTLWRTRELLDRSANVIEIGCGTGTTALRLAPAVKRLTATDVSGEMIAIAREKAEAVGCRNVDFAVASGEGAPGSDAAYDAVLAFNTLHLIPDRSALLVHVRRLLRPGGLFISKTPCLSEMNPLIRFAVPVARLIGKAPSVSFFMASALEEEIAAGGFSIVERDRHGSGRKDPRIFIVARKL